jgi:tetratricopeptide (TPR) repeat protein
MSNDKIAGDAAKSLGNEAYKLREFDQAIQHYQQAWELNKDITYLNNLSGQSLILPLLFHAIPAHNLIFETFDPSLAFPLTSKHHCTNSRLL